VPLALQGLFITHDSYADKSVRQKATDAVVRLRSRWQRILDRLLRRRRDVVVTPEPATLHITGGGAVALVGYGAITLGTDTAEAITRLDERTRDLLGRTAALDQVVRKTSEESRASVDALRAEMKTADLATVDLVRRAAIDGLRREAGGLVLVIFGAILQAWGALA
jgi:hypothetical protein